MAKIKNWTVLAIADELEIEERADFSRCFADMVRLGYSNLEARDDMPFIMIGDIYGRDDFRDGTKIQTSPIRAIKQGGGPKSFIAVTRGGFEYHFALRDMRRSLKEATVLKPYCGDAKRYFASIGQYANMGTKTLYSFLEDIEASRRT